MNRHHLLSFSWEFCFRLGFLIPYSCFPKKTPIFICCCSSASNTRSFFRLEYSVRTSIRVGIVTQVVSRKGCSPLRCWLAGSRPMDRNYQRLWTECLPFPAPISSATTATDQLADFYPPRRRAHHLWILKRGNFAKFPPHDTFSRHLSSLFSANTPRLSAYNPRRAAQWQQDRSKNWKPAGASRRVALAALACALRTLGRSGQRFDVNV